MLSSTSQIILALIALIALGGILYQIRQALHRLRLTPEEQHITRLLRRLERCQKGQRHLQKLRPELTEQRQIATAEELISAYENLIRNLQEDIQRAHQRQDSSRATK